MLKPQLFLWAEWERIILDSAARNALRFAACSAWSADMYCNELWSEAQQCFMVCVMWVWFFIRKFLSSYWSMFRNTSCSYGNQWEFCPCLQIEQEQTPCLQHLGIKWENWEGLLSFTGVERSAYKSRDSHRRSRRAAAHAEGRPLSALSSEKIPNPLLGFFPLPAHPGSWREKAEQQQHLMAEVNPITPLSYTDIECWSNLSWHLCFTSRKHTQVQNFQKDLGVWACEFACV